MPVVQLGGSGWQKFSSLFFMFFYTDNVWFLVFISVLAVSLVSVVAFLFLPLAKKRLKNIVLYLVAFSAGALFGDAFIHLLPELFEKMPSKTQLSLFVLAGILLFFVLEKFIRWRHCHIDVSENHLPPLAALNLVGDGAHNFLDGAIIAASYLVSAPLGVATSLAVLFHEIPQEIGDAGVLLHSGLSFRRALFFNFLSALSAVLGALLTLLVGEKMADFSLAVTAVAAGGFIYIAGSDLIPELQHNVEPKQSFKQFFALLLGISVMLALRILD